MVDQNTMKIMYVFFKILPKCRTLRETKLQKMLPFVEVVVNLLIYYIL